jgi:hypothetical protein
LGNVYVTGESPGEAGDPDYATIKYDANGNRLWVARYNGPGSSVDSPYGLAVDQNGNVYVTGSSSGVSAGLDYATVKYDVNGNQLWVARYDGTPSSGLDDSAHALVIDGAGNVYVTGASHNGVDVGLNLNTDYVTIKYDSDGNRLWLARYDGPGAGSGDQAQDLRLDAGGNVYVTGHGSALSGGREFATIKYDASGNEVWVAHYSTPLDPVGGGGGQARSLFVDGFANVYVTGESRDSSGNVNYATVKYDTDGLELWVRLYDGPDSGTDLPKRLIGDAAGNVYVTGSSSRLSGRGGQDYATIKYDADGTELWVARFSPPGVLGATSSEASDLDIDAAGNVYVTGRSYVFGSAGFDDYVTIKYDPGGQEVWQALYNGPRGLFDGAAAIVVDTAGSVYVTGNSTGVEDHADFATIKYSQNDLTNISTRGRVGTGDNVLIGGFWIGDFKMVLIRARGASLGGPPFNNPGVLANPMLRLFSGQTLIAQNNDWQTAPLCPGPVANCRDLSAILATGLDPCQPNPGQTTAPPGCAQEAVLLVTLPPGGYTAIVSGVGGTEGMALVEVFETDSGPAPITNLSARGPVQTGDNVMIGGFYIGGSVPKAVLVRARGGSLGGAPFNNPGVLENPTLQLYSGSTVIAQNDDWQTTDPLCLSPTIACGNAAQISNTGLDPCQPNPGQSVAPPGCGLESAVLLTLPAGGYTAIVRGVGGTTGLGLVEVFEVPQMPSPVLILP